MANTRIELNLPGINALMKSPEVQDYLKTAAETVAETASGLAGGEAFGSNVSVGHYVAVARVGPRSSGADRAIREGNVLLKAAGQCGLHMSKGE
jgi:hypothetical protein